MKVLLSAYYCHPNRGSEAGVGWNWLKELSKNNEVWAFICAEQGQRKAVEEAISNLDYANNVHIVAIPVPKFLQNRLYRFGYEVWQWEAYRRAKKLIRDEKIEITHHVTIATWWNCGHLWKLNIPFIFGPISGAQRTPRAGYPFLRLKDFFLEWNRTFLFTLLWYLWQRPRHAIKKAKVVLVGNMEMDEKVKRFRTEGPTILFSDVGVNNVKHEHANHDPREKSKSLKLLWAGHLIPLKNFSLLLQALIGLPPDVSWFLRVAGSGSLFNYWKKKVDLLGLNNHISFLGQVDYSILDEQYRWANVFAFPSLREGTGTVIIEAMSYGLPVVALNIHGAKYVLNEDCAFLIPVTNEKQMVEDYRNAILSLYHHPELRRKMGESGRRRVQEYFLWDKRGKAMNDIYRQVRGMEP